MNKYFTLSLITATLLFAGVEDDMAGFDDEPVVTKQSVVKKKVIEDDLSGFDDDTNEVSTTSEKESIKPEGFSGNITQKISYAPRGDNPHDDINSLNSSIFLDYETKFKNGTKFKINAKAYYDWIYNHKGGTNFSQDEKDELKSEVEIFDAYFEGSINDKLDFKVGRQVLVWGRSDTIRVTDVLNPIDNRQPGMTDIEDLRLPIGMVKFDYFLGDWRITPVAILEQRFTKNPPFSSAFNPSPIQAPAEENYTDTTYALSIGGEFKSWDVNFYGANIYNDRARISTLQSPKRVHDKINMYGVALNYLNGSWLLKSEIAYFDKLKYTTTAQKEFSRVDTLVGFEYNGFSDAMLSYDFALRSINSYDNRLINEYDALEEKTYQHAFRVSKDFNNATIKANYLITVFGKNLDKGGFQRAWIKYDLSDDINLNLGIVDYKGGSKIFDSVKNNDMIFADIKYSF